MSSHSAQILQDNEVSTLYPCTYKILVDLNERGYSPRRKAMVLQVFSQIIFDETGQDAAALLDLAERATQQARNLGKR